jgi:hypothetical protein
MRWMHRFEPIKPAPPVTTIVFFMELNGMEWNGTEWNGM